MRISLVQFLLCIAIGLSSTTAIFAQSTHVRARSAEFRQDFEAQEARYQTVAYSDTGETSDCAACSAGVSVPYANHDSGGCTTCGTATTAYGISPCDSVGCDTGYVMDCDPCFGGAVGYPAPLVGFGSVGQPLASGWIQQGVTINPAWPGDRSNGTFRYNDRANDYQLNQLYLTMGKDVNQEGCFWELGGRVDLLYGTDYFYTSAIGLETRKTDIYGYDANNPAQAASRWNSNNGPRRGGTASLYGLSMPQLYMEVQAPYGLNAKLGHFYSPMGHESVMATQNFFYSHSYSRMYGLPTTLTGALFSQRIVSTPFGNWTGYFGIHRGWDKWDAPIDKVSYIAGAKWENHYKTTSVGFLITTGDDGVNMAIDSNKINNRTAYSLILSQQICPNLHYVLQHDLGIEEDAAYEVVDGKAIARDGKWYSISQYLYLNMTPTLSFGCRAEWFKDENHSRVLGSYPVRTVTDGAVIQGIEGDEYVELALGLNWRPTPCMTFRPEVRWDWVSERSIYDSSLGYEVGGPFDENRKSNQFTIGMDLVILF